MSATSGTAAGIESTATEFSFGIEAAWGTAPSEAFQAIRYTSETLSGTKTRQRPAEITASREASAAVTTQEAAAGTVNYALSYGTFDDWIALTLQSDWGAATTIQEAAGDFALTKGASDLTLTAGAAKFDAVTELTWIKLAGFTDPDNNGYWFVTAKATDGSTLTLSGPNFAAASAETPTGTTASLMCSSIRNGTTMRTMFLQQKFASDMWLQYPGAYPTRWTLNGGIGNFFSGGFDLSSQVERKGTADAGSTTVVAANTNRVFDPVNGWVGAYWNEAALGTAVRQMSLTIENTGAAAEFAMGGAEAAGMLGGQLTASGTMQLYFKDFSLYDDFTAETQGRLAFIMKDADGNAYAVTFLSATLQAKITAGGRGQAVTADYTIEGNPSGSGTIVVDRLAA
jgi:Phage tail tube protein